MSDELKIVQTADGSNTIFNAVIGENYHSRHGALQESRHVFLNSGLKYFLDINKVKAFPPGGDLEGAESASNVSILEVGFGTGLNFFLSADFCNMENIHLNYTGIEAYPLSTEMIGHTGYDEYVSPALWAAFNQQYQASLLHSVNLNSYCQLQIKNCKLMKFQSTDLYDVIYFDAFASVNQPEMWDNAAITHTLKFLKPGGVFVTYAITGNLKRIIKSFGLKIEKAPGAPGKREMLRAY